MKENQEYEVRAWFKALNERVEETLESLKQEGVYIECTYLDKQADGLYLIHYMKAEDIAKAYMIFNESNLSIDHFYKTQWKRFCEGRVVLEELLDLHTF
ncbi:MAG: hypothetical protein BGO14_01005 [Chlamydiales bacterium 38-26]|nr:MAG: hypothetical protein BGO14_01005 [Chlamydiales bacterium 38-26]